MNATHSLADTRRGTVARHLRAEHTYGDETTCLVPVCMLVSHCSGTHVPSVSSPNYDRVAYFTVRRR